MNKKGNILIIDDNKEIIEAFKFFLEDEFNQVSTLKTPNQIHSTLKAGNYDIVLLDMNFSAGVNSGNEGLYWLKEILKIDPSIVVILITAYGDVELAVKAIKEGAIDFILKPWDNDKLLATLKSGLKLRESNLEIKKLKSREHHLTTELDRHFPDMISDCDAMKKIVSIVDKVSKTDASILITGENGTGKGMIAREIHKRSSRSKEAMITVDMASLSESLFESELFGHKKGSFTDARQDRIGRFESASGGTLFLDEIGNLSLAMQAKILTALQERKITPVGSNKSIPIDIWLIAATNKNLEKMVDEGSFREDLLFRINTIQIDLPPLRERGNDIEILANNFLRKFTAKYNSKVQKFSAEALKNLKDYSWPGNIRELEHTIEKAVILCENNTIISEDLQLRKSHQSSSKLNIKTKTIDDIEKDAIVSALNKNHSNLSEAAKELGISRQTIYNKMKKYGI
ncbi:MAG: sigma-54-dependent Fis family transcriptional regulator [Bacteroidetes bacterium]|nr:sigma-54-dependent Fis family transcriptional regulator [Bacteroidota bacterium]